MEELNDPRLLGLFLVILGFVLNLPIISLVLLVPGLIVSYTYREKEGNKDNIVTTALLIGWIGIFLNILFTIFLFVILIL